MALDYRVEVVGENDKPVIAYRRSELARQSNWIFNVLEHVLRDNHVILAIGKTGDKANVAVAAQALLGDTRGVRLYDCLLYTSDAADDLLCVDLGGRRIIKK